MGIGTCHDNHDESTNRLDSQKNYEYPKVSKYPEKMYLAEKPI